MREIKFRLWSKIAQSMISWDQVKEKPHTIFDWVNYIPMQYTGLKDVNGKEIYEGDRVAFIGLSKFAVKFDEGKFYFDGEHDNYDMDEIDMDTIEIIGNIHENNN